MDNYVGWLISETLDNQMLMQLATIGKNGPWVCSVWQATDEDMNIYFLSATNRQHSLDIENNPHVAGALAGPHEVGGPGRAVQFSGIAKRLTNADEIAEAREEYEGRIFDAKKIDSLMKDKHRPHAFYKITPNKFVLFDTEHFPENPLQQYLPDWLS